MEDKLYTKYLEMSEIFSDIFTGVQQRPTRCGGQIAQ